MQRFTVLPRVATRVGGDDHGWCDFVDIGRTHTHYELALDAKAATAFPARRESGTGGPTRHVAQTLTEVLCRYVEASTARGQHDTTIATERFGADVQSNRAASARVTGARADILARVFTDCR